MVASRPRGGWRAGGWVRDAGGVLAPGRVPAGGWRAPGTPRTAAAASGMYPRRRLGRVPALPPPPHTSAAASAPPMDTGNSC